MLSKRSAVLVNIQAILIILPMIGCGSGFSLTGSANSTPSTLQVGGNVTGLAAGESVTLSNNEIDEIIVNNDGAFLFPDALDYGASYRVEVATHPATQTCSVTSGSGVVVGGKDISTVAVECVDGNQPEITVEIESEPYDLGGAYDFGAISVNGTTNSKEITVNIKNSGSGASLELDADNVTIGGNDPDVFHLDTINFFLSNPILPGDEVPLTIRFDDTNQGEYSAILNLPNNDADEGNFTLELFGTITDNDEPEIQVLYGVTTIQNGSTVTLAEGATGVVNNYLLNVKNGGQSELNFAGGDLDVYQGGVPEFTLVTANVSPLQEDQEGSIAFSFSPGFPGLFTETFTIDNNDSNEAPFTFTVEINAYDPQLAELERQDNPGVFISDGGLVDFGQARVNETNVTVAMNIVNNGQRDLEITGSPSISGSHPSDFSIINFPSQTTLAPSESLSFSLRFSPTGFNYRTAQIDIPVDDPNQSDGELNVNLGGEGIGVMTALLIDSGDSDSNIQNQSPQISGVYDGFLVGASIFDRDRFDNSTEAVSIFTANDSGDFGSLEINGINGNATNLPSTTWSAWIKPVAPENAPFRFIFSTNDVGSTNKRGLYINGSEFTVGDGSASIGTGISATWGEWQHVAITYTPTDIYFYKNGIEYFLAAGGDIPSQDGADNIRIGALHNGGGIYSQPFEGDIDQVTVTNYARSDEEVRLLAHAAPLDSIHAYFPLNTTQNYDNVGYTGDNGTTSGSPTFTTGIAEANEAVLFVESNSDVVDVSAAAAGLSDSGGAISFIFQPTDAGDGEDILTYDLAGTLTLNWNAGILQLNHTSASSLVLGNNLPFGAWYQVTITWSSTADHLTVYMFGDEVGSTSFPSGTTNANLTFGPMDGALSDVTLYNQAIDSSVAASVGSYLEYRNKIYYPLGDETANYGNNATAATGAATNVAGIEGVATRGSEFNGTTNNKVGPSGSLSYGYSIAAWVKLYSNRATFAGTDREVIVAKGINPGGVAGANDEFFLYIDRNAVNDRLVCEVTDTAGNSADVELHEFESTFFARSWYHIGCVYRQGRLRLYLDGKEVDNDPAPGLGPIGNGTAAVTIGSLSGGGDHFEGVIDNVKVWGRAISASEMSRVVGNSNRGRLAGYPGATYNNNLNNGLDLTNTGSTLMGSGGFDGGNFFSFDGADDYMEGPAGALWDQPAGYTIATWVKIDSMALSAAPPDDAIFAKGTVLNDFSSISSQFTWNADSGSNGTLTFAKSNGASLDTVSENRIAHRFQDGEWFHVTLSASESRLRMYLNGEFLGHTAASGFEYNSDPFYFGSVAGSDAFSGGLDRIRLYNRMLSYSEIMNEVGIFYPSQLPGLRLWLDAARNATNAGGAVTDGNPVDNWITISGEASGGISLQAATAAGDPDYNASGGTGLPAIDFNGSQNLGETTGDLFGTSFAYEFAACWVGNGTAGDYFSFDDGAFQVRMSADNFEVDDGTTTTNLAFASSGTSRIFCARYTKQNTGYDLQLQIDGGAFSSMGGPALVDTDFTTYTNFYLGGTGANMLNGQISELLIWQRPVSLDGLNSMVCHLSAKHGITVSATCN